MAARLRSLIPLLLALAACGEDRAKLTAPRLGTAYVIYGAAGGGRALAPSDLRIVRSTELTSLEIPGEGNLDVDLIYAGLREEDLPSGLTPETLVFVSRHEERTRALPPLVLPHVLAAPTQPGKEGQLVPVEETTLSEDERAYRRERFEALTAELALRDPCEAPAFDFRIPRIPASAVTSARVLSNGDVWLGLTATSTALAGVIDQGQSELRLHGVGTGSTAIEAGEAAAVVELGDGESIGANGRPVPAELGLLRGGVLPHVARWAPAERQWIDETPRTIDPGPAMIRWLRRAEVDGRASLCFGGSVSGSGAIGSGARLGGAWCRPEIGGPWEVLAAIERAQALIELIARDGWPLLALDYSGTVHERRPGGSWQPAIVPASNDCGAVACVRLDAVTLFDGADDRIALLAGDKGQTLLLRGDSPETLAFEPVAAVHQALFADERQTLAFFTSVRAPDGAVWLGGAAPFLLRVSPDLSAASRVCLPATSGGNAVTALAAAADGRLIVATSPPVIGVGTWRRP